MINQINPKKLQKIKKILSRVDPDLAEDLETDIEECARQKASVKRASKKKSETKKVHRKVTPEGIFLVAEDKRDKALNRELSVHNLKIEKEAGIEYAPANSKSDTPHPSQECPDCGSLMRPIPVYRRGSPGRRIELQCSHPDCTKVLMEIRYGGKRVKIDSKGNRIH